ncbi:AhpC/TSA family protein [Desulfopila inferna]|uniref:AhpC/TSA family protein n=1 Tax=Desulfopila inferna TaxID=468528 RepID=UPI00338EFA92
MAELRKQHSSFIEKNAEVAVVGTGSIAQLKEFSQIIGFSGRLFTDPFRQSFKLLGLTGEVEGIMSLEPLTTAYSALRSGFTPESPGNFLQLNGAVIVTPEESVPYLFRSTAAGENPPVSELLSALP